MCISLMRLHPRPSISHCAAAVSRLHCTTMPTATTLRHPSIYYIAGYFHGLSTLLLVGTLKTFYSNIKTLGFFILAQKKKNSCLHFLRFQGSRFGNIARFNQKATQDVWTKTAEERVRV